MGVASLSPSLRGRAEPSRAGPSGAEPSPGGTERSRTAPSRAEPSRAGPNRAEQRPGGARPRPRHAVGLRGAAPIAGAVPAAVRAALPAGPLFFSLLLRRYSAFFLPALFKFVLLSVFLPFPRFALSRFTFFRPFLLPCTSLPLLLLAALLRLVLLYCKICFIFLILPHFAALFLFSFTFLYSILL